jgi:DNA (cytosine-5)-methyltransferase 1
MGKEVYYNEIDKKAAQWLRELIKDGLIPDGEVDERSIEDVKPEEVKGFEQCHFFAGIGGWAEALRLAGWGGRRIWTGSCPCQSFSNAGKKKGQNDKRHLWPSFFRLIRECRPPVVTGEQVEAAIKYGWIDGVRSDLEKEGYSCGFCVLGAHCVGAPHIRQRIYWGAYDQRLGHAGCPSHELGSGPREAHGPLGEAEGEAWERERGGHASGRAEPTCGRVAHAGRPDDGGSSDSHNEPRAGAPSVSRGAGAPGGVGDSEGVDQQRDTVPSPGEYREGEQAGGPGGDVFWESVWHPCRDGKTRRIPASVASEPLFHRMADGLLCRLDEMRPESSFPVCAKVEGRVLLLKGYGNAIVPQVASEFVVAFKESMRELQSR